MKRNGFSYRFLSSTVVRFAYIATRAIRKCTPFVVPHRVLKIRK